MRRRDQSGGIGRRAFLASAASAAAASAVPRVVFAAPVPVSPMMATLSGYMADAGGKALPDEVVQKARDLCGPVIGKAQTNALVEQVFALEKLKNVRELRNVLRKA